jgi:ribosome-binding protein aMBF1 (putative translation factor)
MPLDELQRIEIAIELDKGVSYEELARKFSASASELKDIENLLLKKDVPSKNKSSS